MKKIPTLFERDWNGDRSQVTPTIHPDCEWVINGEGVATRKLDGTCCMMRAGQFFKRRELRKDEPAPSNFDPVEYDPQTGKTVGWILVGAGPEDKYHREALTVFIAEDGTYELIGPKVQGNPENCICHKLVRHSETEHYSDVPLNFFGLKEWLVGKDIEGIVFHHPDGRMAKIKLKDFGLKRNKT